MKQHVLIVGFGYTASYIADFCIKNGWLVTAVSRTLGEKFTCNQVLIPSITYDRQVLLDLLPKVTHVLITAPPSRLSCDPLSHIFGVEIRYLLTHVSWLGYLSSTGVYGDHSGHWVNETVKCLPIGEQAQLRLRAELLWINLRWQYNLPIYIFRLAGIYGPGRNVLLRLLTGKRHTVVKLDHFFSRIHVVDLARAVWLSMQHQCLPAIYNLADDLPAPIDAVEQFAAKLLHYEPLQEIIFDEVEMSPELLVFYQANKKICNQRIKTALSIDWVFPTYVEGLQDCFNYLPLHNSF